MVPEALASSIQILSRGGEHAQSCSAYAVPRSSYCALCNRGVTVPGKNYTVQILPVTLAGLIYNKNPGLAAGVFALTRTGY